MSGRWADGPCFSEIAGLISEALRRVFMRGDILPIKYVRFFRPCPGMCFAIRKNILRVVSPPISGGVYGNFVTKQCLFTPSKGKVCNYLDPFYRSAYGAVNYFRSLY